MSIYGKKGSGKSVMANWWIKQFKRVIIYDTMSCFDNEDFIYVYSLKKFEKLVKEIINQELIEFKICLRLLPDDFERVNKILYFSIRDIVYVIDEIQAYASARSIPYYFNLLITTGRHKRISIITITQRPSNIPNTILSNTDYLIIFETNLKRDLDIFATFKYCSVEKIQTLQDYEFYFIDLKHKKASINKIPLED
jgi:hypothetical protein